MAPSNLILVAPLDGWSAPLQEAPDPVFAGRMMGDGVAIDPIGSSLHAPCDGTLTLVASSRHAVTLRADNGAEVLLHVGIDTVGLAGDGFELHVREGDRVRAGDKLISFDLDLLAQRAKSLMTPIILTDTIGFAIVRRNQACRVEVGDFLMEVAPAAGIAGEAPAAPDEVVNRAAALEGEVIVSLEHGIHARPAASLASAAKGMKAEVSITFGERTASVLSPVGLMSLGIRKGDRILVVASGVEAEAALAAVSRLVAAADSSPNIPNAVPIRVGVQPTAPEPAASREHALKGVVASRGLGVGRAFQFARAAIEVAEPGSGADHEQRELARALDVVRADLRRSARANIDAAREIADAHLGLIDDPELLSRSLGFIRSGKSAGFAWRAAVRAAVGSLRALNDTRMAERADDLLDLESRVLGVLTGQVAGGAQFPAESILIAHELLPSQLAALHGASLSGICLAAGGATSHVAIIAAAMDIPTLVAAGPGALQIATGTPIVLDAEEGWMYPDPPRAQLELARSRLAQRRARRLGEQQAAQRECRTVDGTRIEVFANVGSEAEAHAAVRNGAEGSGLLRTEFLFLDRTAAPDEAEQLDQYQRIARALEGRPLTIRTLDIGGDKPIPYMPLPAEDNPALGLRGVRTSLWRPDLLRVQLRAILGVRPAGQCRILLPMITDAGEIRAVRTMIDEIRSEPVALGAMIETPASVVMADRIARDADFLSIGTNDLTQYTLAMDRGHSELAPRLDALHPAVLRLIARTVEAARVHGRPVAVCGGLASDPVAVPILIGLGIHELSMVPAVIAQMKALIGSLNVHDCAALAREALERETAEDVRALTLNKVSGIDATGRARE